MKLKDKFRGDAISQTFNKMKLSISEKSNIISNKISKKVIIGIGASVIGVAVISTALIVSFGTDVYQLSIDGKKVGYVNSEDAVSKIVKEIQQDLTQENKGIEILYDEKSLDCVPTELDKKEVTFLEEKELKSVVSKSDVMKAKAWALRVDDKNIVASTTKKGANAILEEVKKHYQTPGSQVLEASFKQPVTVTQSAVSLGSIMDKEEAVTYLLTGTKEMQPYVAQDGDTAWDIALKNNMSIDDLLAANPGFDLSKLQIGTKINLVVAKPYVTVTLKEVVARTEEIEYDTTYQNSNTLYAGQVKVKTAGVKGKKEIKSEVIKENGKIVASTDLESKVVAEPQNAIALKGTKAIVAYSGSGRSSGSGNLGSPMGRIQVSSGYGSRGGGRHLGVDLRNPAGTPIYAVESGKVVSAGYHGSYGNLVIINHGGGLQTYYAHCNSLSVSVGQTVQRGQQIATVGATGNATGYHLHFEVRLNGVAQNPFNYI